MVAQSSTPRRQGEMSQITHNMVGGSHIDKSCWGGWHLVLPVDVALVAPVDASVLDHDAGEANASTLGAVDCPAIPPALALPPLPWQVGPRLLANDWNCTRKATESTLPATTPGRKQVTTETPILSSVHVFQDAKGGFAKNMAVGLRP